jgi:hypothetical protein
VLCRIRRECDDACVTAANLSSDLLLPPGARLFHIGPPKTGTTGLQVTMHRLRETLREHGVVYPGKGTRPRYAVWSLVGHPEDGARPPIRHWRALVDEVQSAGDNRVCISTEDWARIDLDGAVTTVGDLADGRAHVVATARPLHRLLPSHWQQRVKMRGTTLSYEEWLRVVLRDGDESDPVWRNFRFPHDIEQVAGRWAKAAGGPGRFTLIVSDEADREQLPRTFEQMLGLPMGMLSQAMTEVRNPSIGYGRTDAIRRLTEAFHANGWRDQAALDELSGKLTDAYKTTAPWQDEPKIPALPAWAADRVAELSEQRIAAVRSLGLRVVGDPEHLRFPESYEPSTEIGPGMVSAELSVRMVEKAVEVLLEQQTARELAHRRKVSRLRQRAAAAKGARVEATSSRDLLREVARRARRRLG